jgi:hypothetical protein
MTTSSLRWLADKSGSRAARFNDGFRRRRFFPSAKTPIVTPSPSFEFTTSKNSDDFARKSLVQSPVIRQYAMRGENRQARAVDIEERHRNAVAAFFAASPRESRAAVSYRWWPSAMISFLSAICC